MSELFKFGEMPLSTSIYTAAGVEELVNNAVVGGVIKLLKFVGISSTDPLTVGATVEGVSTFTEGNVVLWKAESSSEYSEYVYATIDGALKWERLGDASRIGQLEAEVATKAASADLIALAGRVTTAEGEIDALQADIAKKADASALTDGLALKADVTALNAVDGRLTTAEGEIDALQTEIAKKADASALTEGLALKADLAAVNAIDARLATAEGAVATKAESSIVEGIDGRLTTVEGAVATKAEASVVEGIDGRVTTAEGEIDALQAAVAAKADAADVVSKDKLLVLTNNEDYGEVFATSNEILFSSEEDSYNTRIGSGILSMEDGSGSVRLAPDMFTISTTTAEGLVASDVTITSTGLTVSNSDSGKQIEINVSGIDMTDSEGLTKQFAYPDAPGILATEEAMAAKYDSAAEATMNIHGAASAATTALASVTNVNELIAVLNTFFGTVGA